MLKIDEMVPAFLSACPRLRDSIKGLNEARGAYAACVEIARYIVERYSAGDLVELPSAFAVVERCLAEGDHETRFHAMIGVLPNIQHFARDSTFGDHAFERWLQPYSREVWRLYMIKVSQLSQWAGENLPYLDEDEEEDESS